MRVKCLTKDHNTVPRPGLEPRLLDPESRVWLHKILERDFLQPLPVLWEIGWGFRAYKDKLEQNVLKSTGKTIR